MELSKKSELTVGSLSYVISTELAGEGPHSIRTQVVGNDGSVVFETSQDIASLHPIFQNSQKVFARMEAQHQNVVKELKEGRLNEPDPATTPANGLDSLDQETDALEHAVSLLGSGNFEKATAALRAVLDTYPNCSEARELLEVAYKASSGARLPVDLADALKRGTEAFAAGRQREAIEAWKQCLVEEPGNRLLQLLVMLATTWSPERRERYADEVLAAGSASLSAGRPEEAQALLLIAQTVEGGAHPQPSAPPPPLEAAPSAPPIMDEPDTLESLVPDVPDTVAVTGPSRPPALEETESIDSGELDDATTSPDLAKLMASPEARTNVQAPPASQPGSASSSPPPRIAEPEPATPEESVPTTTSRPAPPRPAVRRPMGRARSRSLPWPLIGGAVAAVFVIGVVATWWLSGDGTVPPQRLEQAAGLVGSGHYPQAIAAYDGLLGEFGDHAAIYLGRGRAKVASGDTEGGLRDLKRARDIDPEASAIAEEIGDVYYSSGSYPEAIDYYQRAFAIGPGSAEARYRLAVSLVQRDDSDAAMEHLEAAITSDPQHGEAQFLYAELLNGRGRFAEAERALRASESNLVAGGDFLAELAVSLIGQGKLDEAEEVARNFIRGYPSDARAHALLGEVHLSRHQYEQARAQLIQALRIDRNEPRAQIALGRTWLAIGKNRGDVGDLAKARQVLAGARGAHEGERLLALGQVSLAEGQLEQAQSLLRESLAHGAAKLPVHLSLAEAKARGDDLVGAAEELQRASALAPDDSRIALSLAIAYSQLKEPDRAAEYFLKSIQGIGLMAPPGPDAGPVMLPTPYIPLPQRFDINRDIRTAYRQVLEARENDPTATELKTLAESTTFVLGAS